MLKKIWVLQFLLHISFLTLQQLQREDKISRDSSLAPEHNTDTTRPCMINLDIYWPIVHCVMLWTQCISLLRFSLFSSVLFLSSSSSFWEFFRLPSSFSFFIYIFCYCCIHLALFFFSYSSRSFVSSVY